MLASSYVYILTSAKNGTLYVGVTTNLVTRISKHREKTADGFTKKYNITQLVYYEVHDSIEAAITREKVIKKWKRKWKLDLIEKLNPEWNDLFELICA
ncbi:MAG: GIY-YIG nuclease family protein [Alphaproteobacteria bacterium]|nr:GIY-YIG nuclease family protein [Alphaproteobacteria bacterium]